MSDEPPNAVSAFCIYVDTILQGRVPLERNEHGNPVTYATRIDAEREIAEIVRDRIDEFLSGGRDFEDAVSVPEFVEAVQLRADGSIADMNARVLSRNNW